MTADPRPCLGSCGRLIDRQRSLPLCKADSKRAFAIFLARTRGLGVVEYGRAHSQFYGRPDVVVAALADGQGR